MSPCEWLKMEDGTTVHANRGRQKKKCAFCSMIHAPLLCDYPVGTGKTCDKAVCVGCATRIAIGIDYCPEHKDLLPQQPNLFDK